MPAGVLIDNLDLRVADRANSATFQETHCKLLAVLTGGASHNLAV